MKTLQELQAYIERTPGNFKRYAMDLGEAQAVCRAARGSFLECAFLAFNLGRAKGYRAAKAEQKKRKKAAVGDFEALV